MPYTSLFQLGHCVATKTQWRWSSWDGFGFYWRFFHHLFTSDVSLATLGRSLRILVWHVPKAPIPHPFGLSGLAFHRRHPRSVAWLGWTAGVSPGLGGRNICCDLHQGDSRISEPSTVMSFGIAGFGDFWGTSRYLGRRDSSVASYVLSLRIVIAMVSWHPVFGCSDECRIARSELMKQSSANYNKWPPPTAGSKFHFIQLVDLSCSISSQYHHVSFRNKSPHFSFIKKAAAPEEAIVLIAFQICFFCQN